MSQQKQRHPLTYVFITFAILVLGGSSLYSFLTHPTRQLIQQRIAAEQRREMLYQRAPRSRVVAKPPGPFERALDRTKLVLPYIWPDALLAAAVYVLWLFCLYFYLHQFIVWLSMRGSGEMTHMRGRGLEAKVLGANEDRKKAVV